MTTSKYRLRSSAFARPDEDMSIPPKRVIFLSVEGDNTEIDYFKHLNKQLDNSLIKIELLRHKRGDGYSDPMQVIALLDEYIHLRQGELVPVDSMETLIQKHSSTILQKYLENDQGLSAEQRKEIREDMLLAGIDLDYRRYLRQYNSGDDMFAVVIDRDHASHSRKLMEKCVEICTANGFGCYITNPCFEFWLLLHLCDVSKEYNQEEQDKLRCNAPVSNLHTKTSMEVSMRAHHAKHISEEKFKQYYYPHITVALDRSKSFATNIPDLYDKLGTNLSKLFSALGYE